MVLFRSALLLLSISFIVLPSRAQSNYKPGVVVMDGGDTLRGFIDQKEWPRNPKSFSFKKSAEDPSGVELDIHKVRYFVVEGDEYTRYEGPVSMDKNSTRPADILAIHTLSDPVFLKTVTKGKMATLFSYRDQLKNRFLLSMFRGTPEELIYRFYPDETQNNQIVTDDRYKQALLSAAQSTGNLSDKLRWLIKKSSYGTRSLGEIVDKINGGTKIMIPGETKEPLHLFAVAAINRSDLKFAAVSGLRSLQTTPSYGPYLSAGIDILAKPAVGRLVIRGELSFNVSTLRVLSDSAGYYTFNFATTQYTLGLSPQILYNFYNTKRMKIYFGGGLRFNKSFYSNNDFLDQPVATTTHSVFNYFPLWISLNFQAGILINRKFEFLFSYNPQWGQFINNFDLWAQSVNYTRIGLNYHFDKK